MLALAREAVPEADVRLLVLPKDPIPEANAIVSESLDPLQRCNW
jgi:hypothetical protein